jgi:long-chain acyl-CoA synthetase
MSENRAARPVPGPIAAGSTPPACPPTSTRRSTRRWWPDGRELPEVRQTAWPTASWARTSPTPDRRLSRALAAYLQGLGLAKGDRVAIMMPNVPQYPVAVAAILRAGFVVVNVNPLYTRASWSTSSRTPAPRPSSSSRTSPTRCSSALPSTPVKHVVLAAMGDQLGLLKGALVNYVVRNVKKMVPAFSLPGAVRFNDAVARARAARSSRPDIKPDDVAVLQYTGGTTGREQGRRAAAPQRDRQRAAVRGLERAGHEEGAGGRAAHQRVRAAAVPHLRLHGEHDAVHAHGRQAHPDPQPARPAAVLKELSKHTFHSFPAVNTLFNGLANHPDFNTVNWKNLRVRSAAAWRCKARWPSSGWKRPAARSAKAMACRRPAPRPAATR